MLVGNPCLPNLPSPNRIGRLPRGCLGWGLRARGAGWERSVAPAGSNRSFAGTRRTVPPCHPGTCRCSLATVLFWITVRIVTESGMRKTGLVPLSSTPCHSRAGWLCGCPGWGLTSPPGEDRWIQSTLCCMRTAEMPKTVSGRTR